MYFLIIILGLLLAIRGSRPAPLERPDQGLARVWREAADFFLTASLILTIGTLVSVFGKTEALAGVYAVFGFGLAAYLLSRHQGKSDVFFLAVFSAVFMISSKQQDLFYEIARVGAVSVGMAVFQTCFLGLRYKLLFSRVPPSVKGWPILCLLAAFISVILWSLGSLVF